MYSAILVLHSLVRWLVLAAAAWAAFTGWRGLREGRNWGRGARVAGALLAAAADIQLLLGLALWLALSPHAIVTGGAGSAHWTYVHPLLGISVVALAHVGSVRSRRTPEGPGRWRTAAAFSTAALVVALVAVPWPFLGVGRALLPF
jgi:hypothetical protein